MREMYYSCMKRFKVFSESAIEIALPGKEYSVKKYSNFTIENTLNLTNNSTYVERDVFIVAEEFLPHFHFIRETLGQYSFIDANVGNVDLVFIHSKDSNTEKIIPEPYIDALTTIFGLSDNSIFNLNNFKKLVFKSALCVTNDAAQGFLSEVLGPSWQGDPVTLENSRDILKSYSLAVRDRAWSKLGVTPTLSRDIYLSRKNEDLDIEMFISSLAEYIKGGACSVGSLEKKEMLFNLFSANRSHGSDALSYGRKLEFILHYAIDRMLTNQDHLALETYYNSINFEVLDMSEYDLIDQILIFSEARTVVGLAGGALVNCSFSSPESSVVILSPTNAFEAGSHDFILPTLIDKTVVLPSRQPEITVEGLVKNSAEVLISEFSSRFM